MNITRIINVVGQLQSLLAVLDQLPPATQREVVGTLKSNGIDPALLAKQAVLTKHTLQAMPAETFVPMLRISALHLEGKSRRQVRRHAAGSLRAGLRSFSSAPHGVQGRAGNRVASGVAARHPGTQNLGC